MSKMLWIESPMRGDYFKGRLWPMCMSKKEREKERKRERERERDGAIGGSQLELLSLKINDGLLLGRTKKISLKHLLAMYEVQVCHRCIFA